MVFFKFWSRDIEKGGVVKQQKGPEVYDFFSL